MLLVSSCGQDAFSLRDERKSTDTYEAGMTSDVAGSCGCSLTFNPVCGTDNKTYDSPCVANCLGVSYTFGACDFNGNISCSSTVQYVCAQPPMPECDPGVTCAQVMPSPKAYLNLCQMVEAGAVFINNGVCK